MLPWIRQQFTLKKTVTACACFLVAGFFIFAFPPEALANAQQDTLGINQVEQSGIALGGTDIRVIIARIIQIFIGILGTITVVLIIYAGALIMLSGGDEGKVAQGKRLLTNAIIGLIIILSAFAIATFVLRRLSRATGTGFVPGGGGGAGGIQLNTFAGSGALGRIIADHYPFVNEQNVPRNAKVVVTFRESALPQSVITDFNNSGVLGDCTNAPGTPVNWAVDCDRMATTSVRLFETNTPSELFEAAAIATTTGGAYHTFVFRPLTFLGSDTSTVRYTVALTDRIRKGDDSDSIFVSDPDRQYRWSFETGTEFDFGPPSVSDVYPRPGTTVARNTIFQIHFSEPIDPSTVQGVAGNFTHILFGSTSGNNALPQGEWRVTNGYRTVEFTPSAACGQNSCGETMFCVVLDCANPNDQTCTNSFQTLARTADLVQANPGAAAIDRFQAAPFTGLQDLAGNALDSGPADGRGIRIGDGRLGTPHKPQPANIVQINANELTPPGIDNFWWDFTIRNTIDRGVPYVERITPGIDQEQVNGNAPLELVFNMPLWFRSLNNIVLEEYPSNVSGLRPIYFSPRAELVRGTTPEKTRVEMRHREFGPDGRDLFYFVSVPSQVRSINQNCVYPGRGPTADVRATGPSTCTYVENADGTTQTNTCVPVDVRPDTDTGCVQTTQPAQGGVNLRLQPNVDTCLQFLRQPGISSTTQR